MEGFKSNTKMQCFKEGGSVAYKSRKQPKESMSADIKQDKAIVKKAIGMHDAQEHKGEHTDLSKLKKGGRAKKEAGSVRKYKTGGSVENIYGAKKKAGDLDNIQKTKDIKPVKLCAGKSVKKYAIGGSIMDNIMGSPEQNKTALANEAKYLAAKRAQRAAGAPMGPGEIMAMKLAQAGQSGGLGQAAPAAAPAPAVQAPGGTSPAGAIPTQKRGGKVKKMNTGGTAS